MFCK